MGKERDTLRTGVAAVTVTEKVAIGMVIVHAMEIAHAMEMVVATEMGTATQKAAAVILMAIGMGRTDTEAQAGTGRAGVQMMAAMGRAGKKVVIVRARWTPRWNPRWKRQTRPQTRQLMVSLSQSHPNARRVDGTVRGYVLKCEVCCL